MQDLVSDRSSETRTFRCSRALIQCGVRDNNSTIYTIWFILPSVSIAMAFRSQWNAGTALVSLLIVSAFIGLTSANLSPPPPVARNTASGASAAATASSSAVYPHKFGRALQRQLDDGKKTFLVHLFVCLLSSCLAPECSAAYKSLCLSPDRIILYQSPKAFSRFVCWTGCWILSLSTCIHALNDLHDSHAVIICLLWASNCWHIFLCTPAILNLRCFSIYFSY